MSDFFHKAARSPVSRKRRFGRLGFILLIVALAALFLEHRRGERALRMWKTKMEAQGEIFGPNKLWPPANPASRQFSNQLAEAVGRLPMTLNKFAGSLAGLSLD